MKRDLFDDIKAGGIAFVDLMYTDLLEARIALKRQEARDLAERPHPREFELYLHA